MLGLTAANFKLPPGAKTYNSAGPDDALPDVPVAAPPSAPTWVPWAIGAVVGGGILYLLLRD